MRILLRRFLENIEGEFAAPTTTTSARPVDDVERSAFRSRIVPISSGDLSLTDVPPSS